MIGVTKKANGPMSGGSDFLLLELNSAVPEAYNPYYNGWNRGTPSGSSGVGIHHPGGDIKKISTYTTGLSSCTPNVSGEIMATNAAWCLGWASTTNGTGVTEGGSSGSPLFDSNGRIVGTLSGGSSTCANPTAGDAYGKFAIARSKLYKNCRFINKLFNQLQLILVCKCGYLRIFPTFKSWVIRNLLEQLIIHCFIDYFSFSSGSPLESCGNGFFYLVVIFYLFKSPVVRKSFFLHNKWCYLLR